MNINRHNYEEFFLLYVDGELSAKERQLVELFVQGNADLASELKMFEQTKLHTEDIVFADKSSLYKTNNAIFNPVNYEQNLLLYIDDELSNAERNEIENLVLQHPQLQDKLTLLQQTKLEPETSVFPDKKSLYRKEERRVVYFSWQKISMAASFIGFALLIWNVLPVSPGKNKNVAVLNNQSKKIINNNLSAVPVTIEIKESATIVSLNTVVVKNEKDNNNKTTIVFKGKKSASAQFQKREVAKIIDEPSMNEPKKTNVILAVNNNNIKTDVINLPSAQPKNILTSKQLEANPQSLVQNTVYKELDTDEEVKNNNLYIGSIGVNKDKIRGLLKRASHLFDKTSNNDDKNLAIANFAVNTKSLK